MNHYPASKITAVLGVVFFGICGCDVASSKPKQEAPVAIASEPVVTGDANEIVTRVDARIRQTQNELWPWVILLLGLSFVLLIGFPVTLFSLAWLVRRWITANSYVGQFQRIAEMKAHACRTNGAKP